MFTRNRFAHHNLLHISIFVTLTVLVAFYGCSDKQSNEKASTGDVSSQKKEWLSIMGGVIGGSFSQFAGGISHVLTHQEPHIKISIEASAGSIENTRRVNEDPEGLGVVFASECYLGYHGQEIFTEEGPKTNIRIDITLYCLRPIFNTGK